MTTPKLVTLLPSTDVDLGRWLLQHWQMPYHEKPHAPIFHILALYWNGVGKDDYPLLVDDWKKTPTIEKFLSELDPKAAPERRLVPDAETEAALNKEVMASQHASRYDMGGGTVHWAYFHFLQHKKVVWPSITTGVPWWETTFLMFGGYPIIKSLMFKGLSLSAEGAQKALDTVRKAFDDADQRLSDGRQFFFGDRLTIADLAFSASAGPMVLAKGYGG
ncbi:MAG: glutathione S-transferase domain-containing protein, partial [Pseudomonadota bacterium]